MQCHVHCNNKGNNTVDNNLGLHKFIFLRVSVFHKHWLIYFLNTNNAKYSWGQRKGGREERKKEQTTEITGLIKYEDSDVLMFLQIWMLFFFNRINDLCCIFLLCGNHTKGEM